MPKEELPPTEQTEETEQTDGDIFAELMQIRMENQSKIRELKESESYINLRNATREVPEHLQGNFLICDALLHPTTETELVLNFETEAILQADESYRVLLTEIDAGPDAILDTKLDTGNDTIMSAKLDTKLDTTLDTKLDVIMSAKLNTALDTTLETTLDTKLSAKLNTTLETTLDTKLNEITSAKLNTTLETTPDTKLSAKLSTTLETTPDAKLDVIMSADYLRSISCYPCPRTELRSYQQQILKTALPFDVQSAQGIIRRRDACC